MLATEQTCSNAAIPQAVAEAAWVAIQTMTMPEAEKLQSVGPKLGRLILNQMTLN